RDDHARALTEPETRLAPPTGADVEQRTRFHAPIARALENARAFVAVADADELSEHPGLLRTGAAAFDPHDDATLAIATTEEDVEAVHARLAQALDAAGLTTDTD